MLVYGDPQYQSSPSALVKAFDSHLVNSNVASLDDWRTLLIEAGKLEQGIADYLATNRDECVELLGAAMALTNRMAERFCQLYGRESGFGHPNTTLLDTGTLNPPGSEIRELLNRLQAGRGPLLTIKVPEGFAFYALFPEQYCAAAIAWSTERNRANDKNVLVVGIRSIGTSLSGVVMQTLLAAGWNAERVTVRPAGHPFQRQITELPKSEKFRCAIIVDEGPGISGSSMAAAAAALKIAGVTDISLFPGHAGEPGSKASDEIRKFWAGTPRYFIPLEKIQWSGLSLTEWLCVKSQEFTKNKDAFVIQDVSAGAWRKRVFANEKQWPAVAGQFERMKFLCASKNGASVLWKFAGLGASIHESQSSTEAARTRLSRFAEKGLAPKPLGIFRGFVATHWLEGSRFRRKDATMPAPLSHIGSYVLEAAKPALAAAEAEEARSRLVEMLYWNTKETLGEEWAEQTRIWSESTITDEISPSYGDGHLAPEEWIRTKEGRLLKTDCEGHDADHTLIGPQSILWDVAGALVEWNMDSDTATSLLQPLRDAGISFDENALSFYQMAYAAFRMGLVSLSTSQTSDTDELARLNEATEFYRKRLLHLLTRQPTLLRTAH